MNRLTRATTCAGLALLVALPLAACRGDRSEKPPRQFLPDMDDQEKNLPQSQSNFFQDYTDDEGNPYGRAQREPIEGSVPFARALHANWRYDNIDSADTSVAGVDFSDRRNLLADDDAYYKGIQTDANGAPRTKADGTPLYVQRMPVTVDKDLIALGRENYNIYCLPCHGGSGMGDGMVGRRWSYVLPRFTDDIYMPAGEKSADGYIFHTIRNGLPNEPGASPALKMPGYARKLTVEESWAIVAYVRTLQAAGNADINWIDPAERQRLELDKRRNQLEDGS